MARPLKSGLDYFPHDTDAVSDEKVESLMALYGCEGYAFFFVVLERIFRTENGVLPMGKLTDKVGITRKLGLTVERFNEILATAIEIDCFDREQYGVDGSLTSNGIRKRIEKVSEVRIKERKRKEEYKEKEKAIHGKPAENLRKTKKSFKIPTLEEVRSYCLERKNSINVEKWYAYYSSNGWKVGKNGMVDWKMAVITWENSDLNKKEDRARPMDAAGRELKYL